MSSPNLRSVHEPARRRHSGLIWAVGAVAGVLSVAIILHSQIPGSLGTLNATLLPWLGWLVPVIIATALILRHRRLLLFTAVPALAWLIVVMPTALPLGEPAAGGESFVVATQNVRASASAATESAQALVDADAAVIGLVELTPDAREAAATVLESTHPYSFQVGTVGLWSMYPLELEQPQELGLGWRRALSADVLTPGGTVSVYVVHAASFRPGNQAARDAMLETLGTIVPTDLSEQLIVMGDFNATTFDPALAPLLETVSEARQSTLSWGFTWPADFPVARIDHVFSRGLRAVENRVAIVGESDHRAVLTRFEMEHPDDAT